MEDTMGTRQHLVTLGALLCMFTAPLSHAQTTTTPYEGVPDLFDSFDDCLPAARLMAKGDGYSLDECTEASASSPAEAQESWVCRSSKRSGDIKGCENEESNETHPALESGREFVCEKFKHHSGREMVALYMKHAYSKAFSASVFKSRDGKKCQSSVWQSHEMSRFYNLCPTRSHGEGAGPIIMRDRDVVAAGGTYYFGRDKEVSSPASLSSRPETVSTIHYFKGKGGKSPCAYAKKPTQDDRERNAPLSAFVRG